LKVVVLDRFGRAQLLNGNDPSWDRLGRVEDVALGVDHQCVLRGNGRVLCKGPNDTGELGLASERMTRSVDFRVVNEIPVVARIGVQNGLSCASTQGGELWCWGYVNGAPDQAPMRVELPGTLRDWAMAENDMEGGFHGVPQTRPICVVLEDNSIWCTQVSLGGVLERVAEEPNAEGWRRIPAPGLDSIAGLLVLADGLCTISGDQGAVHCLAGIAGEEGFAPITTGDEVTTVLLDESHRITANNELFKEQQSLAQNVVDGSANRVTLCFASADGQLQCSGRLSALLVGENQCNKYFMTGW
jgi:hypothetical protein